MQTPEPGYTPRLVAYVNLWGVMSEQERDAQLAYYTRLLKNSKLDAKIYAYGDDNGAPIIGVRFNGPDIDRVANCLNITAGDLLAREVGLGNPYEKRD